MEIKDLYRNLSHGVLKNLTMSGEGSGDIREKDRGSVILAANEALLRIYSRFILREKDALIQMVDGITSYHLLKRFAQFSGEGGPEHYRYILDMALEPFEEDVIKIIAAYNSDGYQMPLNDNEAMYSLFTPQANVLQVPNPEEGRALSVLYQARHPELIAGELSQPIELPDVLHGAFYAHIGYQLFESMGTVESIGKSQLLLQNYENICSEAEKNDSVQTSISTTNSRFEKRGWV